MKRILPLFLLLLIFVSIFNSCKPDPIEELGSIYGIVTDKATGEPVKNANVQLRPSGETTLTGTDGRYEFLDLKNGNYSIVVSKTEYTDLVDDYVITIDGSKAIRRDVQIEKTPGILKILDSNGNEIEELDFGSMQDDNTRMFSIFNNSTMSLEYELYKTASWIIKLSSESGTMSPGATKTIVITIDRKELSMGDNKTTLTVVTNNGGKSLVIKANKPGDISTKEAKNIKTNSATLFASINKQMCFSEKGFYYGTDSNVSNKKVVSGNSIGEFSYNLTSLQEGMTYYFKAYMIVDGETVFGELRSFKTNVNIYKPTVTTNSVSDITETSAVCGGNVTSDGGSPVTARGVCWSVSPNPTVNDNKTVDGTGKGIFTSNIVGLTSDRVYYVRAYATNSKGTIYGEEKSFTTNSDTPNHNGHEYVDLGLSVKWATCNVGANKPEGNGDYYAWGEVITKDFYDEETCDTDNTLFGEDISGYEDYDVAAYKLGGGWRMPTKAEMKELKNKCDWKWTTQNGVNGYKVTSKNGNYIFLPAAGYRYDDSYFDVGGYGNYWCSTPVSAVSHKSYGLFFSVIERDILYYYREYGRSVRPVID